MTRREFMFRRKTGIFIFLIFILNITFLASGAEESETPFEYNSRWYQNDFKWWEIWHKELYGEVGENTIRDNYNARQSIDSVNRLKRWVLPEKAGLFESFIEFYESVRKEAEEGNLRRHDIRRIKSSLQEKRKEFIARFHYKNIKPEEWINKEIVDKSLLDKVETPPMIITSNEKSGYRYIAHRNGKVFHKLNCEVVDRIKESDRVYFKTKRRALSTGRKPCRECKP